MERIQIALSVHRSSSGRPMGSAHAVLDAGPARIELNILTNVKVLRLRPRMLVHDHTNIGAVDIDRLREIEPTANWSSPLASRPVPNRFLQSNNDIVILPGVFLRGPCCTVIGEALARMDQPVV